MNTHESEDYWSDEIMTEIYGEPNPHKEGKEYEYCQKVLEGGVERCQR
jgi:hypothetical protein